MGLCKPQSEVFGTSSGANKVGGAASRLIEGPVHAQDSVTGTREWMPNALHVYSNRESSSSDEEGLSAFFLPHDE